MDHRHAHRPSRDLLTENLRVGVSRDVRRALTDVAQREGKSVAHVVRDAVADAIERGNRPQDTTVDRRGAR